MVRCDEQIIGLILVLGFSANFYIGIIFQQAAQANTVKLVIVHKKRSPDLAIERRSIAVAVFLSSYHFSEDPVDTQPWGSQ